MAVAVVMKSALSSGEVAEAVVLFSVLINKAVEAAELAVSVIVGPGTVMKTMEGALQAIFSLQRTI